MDQSRRTTLKALGAAGISAATGITAAGTALADSNPSSGNRFSIRLEHSWTGTQTHVIIKNSATEAATISNITPAFLSAEPGIFDFSKITSHGPVTLAAGEEIRVPFVQMGTPVTIGHFDHTVQKRLKASLVIETEGLRIADTRVSLNPRIV